MSRKTKAEAAHDVRRSRTTDAVRRAILNKEINQLTGTDKLNFEIGEIRRSIVSCEYDISNGLKVQNKLSILKENLKNKLSELELINNQNQLNLNKEVQNG